VTVPNSDGGDEDFRLSAKDVEFLRAVRDINEDPESYDLTDDGARPANTASIREATSLNTNELQYRLQEGEKLEKYNLLEIFDAVPQNGTMGPKGVELTEAGERALEFAEKTQPPRPGSERWDLEERISETEDRIERIFEELERASDVFEQFMERLDELDDAVTELQADLSDIEQQQDDLWIHLNRLRASVSESETEFVFDEGEGASEEANEDWE